MRRLNEPQVAGVIAEAFAIRASTATRSSLHAQHGAALFVGLDADVVVGEPGRTPIAGRAVVVAPDRAHAAVSPGPTLGMLFDPERMPHVAAFARAGDGAFALTGRLGARVREAALAQRAAIFEASTLAGIAEETAAMFAASRDRDVDHEWPRRLDRRVAAVARRLREPHVDHGQTSLRVDVGDAHLRALFARDVGLPMRTYRLWHRLLRALRRLAETDATAAAHAAGFADLAHFSRTCRRMLGYTPTVLRRGELSTAANAPSLRPA
ncbi:AraC-type DNA-binding protein [Nannocystis exedens]|uniref:AraC-type DNA-binding protein n=1 Tax=Nannocystis exedens TaxID=54 RepID=A0A1I2GZV5_9BACT|nr:AraC family transcriptional regulator [Nannocystis exedens]SFF22690.1 AraC-type DNA-binding protein [Nannocystis exedens]